MNFDHKFLPRNKREVSVLELVEAASQVLESSLNLKNITVRVERMAGWAGADACYAGRWMHNGMVKINFRNLYGATYRQVLEVVGHEFRHAVQTQHNLLDKDIPDTDWAGRDNRYMNRPVEKDARKYQSVYAQLVIDNDYFKAACKFFNADEIVDGEAPTLPDYNASYAAIGRTRETTRLFADREKNLFWFGLEQVRGKKWTPKLVKSVWVDYRDDVIKQPFNVLRRPATINDLVC